MAIYLISLSLLFISGFFVKDKRVGFLCILFLLFLSLFRADSVGLDTINYTIVDSKYEATGIKRIEIIYPLFTHYLIPIFGRRSQLFIYSTLTFLFISLSCKRYRVRPSAVFFFFVLFVFFNLSLNISRQYVSASILLYAYSFLIENDKKRFLVFVLLAALFHVSSLFFIPVIFLRKVDLNKVNKYLLFVLIIAVFVTLKYLSPLFVDWANAYALLSGEDMEAYLRYFNQAEVLSDKSTGGLIVSYAQFVLNLIILFYLIKQNNAVTRFVSIVFLVSIIISSFAGLFFGNIGRLQYSISIMNIIAYATYFSNMGNKGAIKYMVLFLVTLFWGYEYLYSLEAGCYGTVPYKF